MTNPCLAKKKLFPCINKSFFVLFGFGLAELENNSYLRTMKQILLKQEVERTVGRQLTEARDFEELIRKRSSFLDKSAFS